MHKQILVCSSKRKERRHHFLSLMYVDDGLVASTDSEMLESFMKSLRNEFKITEKDRTYFLGFQIKQIEDGSITVSQAAYTRKLLKKFDMEECKPDSKPLL